MTFLFQFVAPMLMILPFFFLSRLLKDASLDGLDRYVDIIVKMLQEQGQINEALERLFKHEKLDPPSERMTQLMARLESIMHNAADLGLAEESPDNVSDIKKAS